MRTTLTLDQDVAVTLERLRREREMTMKKLVNEALREGLRVLDNPPEASEPFKTDTVSLGRCLIGDLADVAEALALAEGDDFR
jgi:hypothetical protein